MAFKPNYGRDRAERARAARARSEEKKRKKDEKTALRKAQRPKPSRRRMKPILDWTKSKAEAYAPGAAPIQFFAFLAGISEIASCGSRRSAAVRCDTERDAQACNF